jgi:predicted  nucleic acid-binding Zn-ribbon protein
MDEPKIAESTNSDALLHLRANRVLLARRINEIARKMVDLRIELETLDEEMKAKAHQLKELDRGIRALVPGVPPAQP